MNLHSRRFFPLFALLLPLASPNAHAQGALYVTPVATRVGLSTADSSPTFAFLGTGVTSRMFYGVQFGGFYDIPLQRKQVEVGIDVRDSVLHGNSAFLNSFLVGPRLAVPLADHPRLHPYVEPVVGVGSTRAPRTAIKVNKLQYGVFVGADYDLNRHVTFRAVELGFSSLTVANGGIIGQTETVPAATLFTVASGLTFRLP